MIAHVCTSLGWTWDYCLWNLDIPRITALNAYWRNSPPIHVLVASFLGVKPKAAGAPAEPTQEEQQFFDSAPVQAAPQFLSAQEYLTRKASNGEQQ